MKKGLKLLSGLLFAMTIAGCSCSNPGVKTYLPNSKDVISGSKTDAKLTTEDIYQYVRENDSETYNKVFMRQLLEKILKDETAYTKDTENKKGTFTTTYQYKLKKYFNEEFVEKDDFKINGVFNEQLLVAHLRSNLSKVNDPLPVSERVGDVHDVTYGELNLEYDYSEFVKAEVDYLIYMEMLKEDYISNTKSKILDDSRTRIITVYSADNLDDMEDIVEDIFSGEYASLKDLEQNKIDEAVKEIGRQYCENLGIKNPYYLDEEGEMIETCSPTKNSYDSSYTTFTTCENGKKCDLDAGLLHQVKEAKKKKYLTEQVVNKDTKDVLFENALKVLLREDVEDYLVSDEIMQTLFTNDEIRGDFLMTNLASGQKFDQKSIILSSAPDSTCYIVLVRTVDSETGSDGNELEIEDKQRALELLHDKVGETSVLLHYLDNTDVELIDSKLIESYKSLIK